MRPASQADLFGAPSEAPARPRVAAMDAGHHALTVHAPRLVRAADPDTSHVAAATIAPHLTALQNRVLTAFAIKPMTALEAEALPGFAGLKATTVRHRVSELARAPLCRLVRTGEKRDGAGIYRLATPDETRQMQREAGV